MNRKIDEVRASSCEATSPQRSPGVTLPRDTWVPAAVGPTLVGRPATAAGAGGPSLDHSNTASRLIRERQGCPHWNSGAARAAQGRPRSFVRWGRTPAGYCQVERGPVPVSCGASARSRRLGGRVDEFMERRDVYNGYELLISCEADSTWSLTSAPVLLPASFTLLMTSS